MVSSAASAEGFVGFVVAPNGTVRSLHKSALPIWDDAGGCASKKKSTGLPVVLVAHFFYVACLGGLGGDLYHQGLMKVSI